MMRFSLLAIVLAMLGACGMSSDTGPLDPGGESHFMGPCEDDAGCGDGYACVCGTCTMACFNDTQCGELPEPSVCVGFEYTPGYGSCKVDEIRAPRVCLPACTEDAECGVWGLSYCVEGACSATKPGEPVVLVPSGPLDPTPGPVGTGTAPVYASSHGQLFLASPAHLLRSTDGGRTWSEAADARAGAIVEADGVLAAVFAHSGVSRSLDGGAHWHNVVGLGLDGDVFDLVARAGRLYAVAGDRDASGRNLLFVSSDAGDSWSAIASLPDGEAIGAFFAADDVLVATGLYSGRLFRSTDAGASWRAIDGSKAGWATAVTEFRGDLFAMAPGLSSVFRSTDRGATWSEMILSSFQTRALGLPHLLATGEELFAAMGSGDVYRWDATLGRWLEASEGLRGGRITAFAGGAAGVWLGADEQLYRWSRGSSRWEAVDLTLVETQVVALAGEGGILVASSGGDAVHRSEDGGATWSRSSAGLPTNSRVLQLGTNAGLYFASTAEHGLFHSSDGVKWFAGNTGVPRLADGLPARVSAFAFDGPTAWAATTDDAGAIGAGVLRSEDAGATWKAFSTGLPKGGEGTAAITALLFVDDALYAATAGDGVFRSTDRGETWTQAASGLEIGDAFGRVSALAASDVGVLAAVEDGERTQLFVTMNDGSRWETMGEGGALPGAVRSLVGRSGLLAASVVSADGGGALYSSNDGGGSWTTAKGEVVPGPLVVGNDALFVGTGQAGVWRLGLTAVAPPRFTR